MYLKNIFTNIEYKTVDIALSGSQKYNESYMYTRLIKYNDIIFNTGLNLIFNRKDSFIKSHISKHKKIIYRKVNFPDSHSYTTIIPIIPIR